MDRRWWGFIARFRGVNVVAALRGDQPEVVLAFGLIDRSVPLRSQAIFRRPWIKQCKILFCTTDCIVYII